MSCFIKTSQTFAYEPGIMSFGFTPVVVMTTNGRIKAWWYNGTSYPQITSTTICNDGKFHHICMTYNGTEGKVNLFIDGKMEGSLSTNNIVRFSGLDIGVEKNVGNKIFNGIIDDVRFYDHTLSDREVRKLAQAKILHYKFDQYVEPTTNLISDYNLTTTGSYGITYTYVGMENGYKKYSISGTWSGGSYPYSFSLNSYTYPSGISHSASCYIYNNIPHKFLSNFGNLVVVNDAGLYGAKRVVRDGHYSAHEDYIHSINNYTNQVYVYSAPVANGTVFDPATDFVYLKDFQIEAKPYATPYVNGSRTYATVKDSSGYGLDGSLTSISRPTTPRCSIESKHGKYCYKFNGVDTYLITGILPSSDQFTISLWFKQDSYISQARLFWGAGTDRAILATVDTNKLSFYCGTSVSNTGYITSNLSYSSSEWNHAVLRYNGANVELFINGQKDSSIGTVTGLSYQSGFYLASRYDLNGNWFNGKIDDFSFYTSALSDTDIENLYKSYGSVDNQGNIELIDIDEIGFEQNIVRYDTWVVGTTGANAYFSLNGPGSENIIVVDENPIGEKDIMWSSPSNDVTSNDDGGWVSSTFPIDKTKKYRFSCWFRREGIGIGSGTNYFGCQANTVLNLNGTLNNNPYFKAFANDTIPEGTESRWLLAIGFVHPETYALLTSDPESGIYDSETGEKLVECTDFKWTSTTTSTFHRVYLYYSTNVNEKAFWYRPRVDLVDGNEPTIDQLRRCAEHRPLINFLEGNNINIKAKLKNNGIMLANELSEVGITKGLQAWFPLNGDTKEIMGSGLIGNIDGAILTSGINGMSYDFDYTTDRIAYITSNSFNCTNAITISAWFNSDNIALDQNIVSRNGPYFLRVVGSKARFCLLVDGTWLFGTGGVTLQSNTWYNICMTYDGSLVKGYVNAVEDYSNAKTGSFGVMTNLYIGYTPIPGENAPFDGRITDVRIYNRALSAQEVSILYNSTNGLGNTKSKFNNDKIYLNGKISEVD
jgi:hypothetical protein